MYCRACGIIIDNDARICPFCQADQDSRIPLYQDSDEKKGSGARDVVKTILKILGIILLILAVPCVIVALIMLYFIITN